MARGEQAYSDYRKLFGTSGLYLNEIADFVHNVGNPCAVFVLMESDMGAASLLDHMLSWPANTERNNWRSCGRNLSSDLLLGAIRDLTFGDSMKAKSTLKDVRPLSLAGGSPEQTRAWCLLWQMARLAVFRALSMKSVLVINDPRAADDIA